MGEPEKVGQHVIRISGRLFSVEHLIDLVEKNPISPSQWSKVAANVLAMVLCITMNRLGGSLVNPLLLVVAIFVHELGHYIGLKFTGCKDASYGIGVLGPFAVGNEGISSGRKAMVSLFGPCFGLFAGAAVSIVDYFVVANLKPGVSALLFFSVLNLLPVKPFDGYAVVEHLVFIRYPKVELIYLISSGVILFLVYFASFYRHDHPFYAFFYMGLGMAMFHRVKKMDNMSDMVVRLRENGNVDFAAGRFRPESIKRMIFSLTAFEFQNEVEIALVLREVWDRAWEVPPCNSETIIILTMYFVILLGGMTSASVIQIFSAIL